MRALRSPSAPPLALILLLGLAGCWGRAPERTGDDHIVATALYAPTPPTTGTSGLIVEVTDSGVGVPAESSVTAIPVSPSGARGDPVVLSLGGGRWEGTIEFREAGEAWLELAVVLPDGRAADFRIPLTVVRGGG